MFEIDWSPININTLITLLGWAGGILFLFASFKSDLLGLKKDVVRLEEAVKQISTVLTQVAVQDQRLHMLERYIEELRHGKGFIRED